MDTKGTSLTQNRLYGGSLLDTGIQDGGASLLNGSHETTRSADLEINQNFISAGSYSQMGVKDGFFQGYLVGWKRHWNRA